MPYQILSLLAGKWHLARTVTGKGHAMGHARFIEQSDGALLYEENGMLDLNGYAGEFYRRFRYEFSDDRVIVRYQDPYRFGDVLHELVFNSDGGHQVARHCHSCGEDTYEVVFCIEDRQNIRMDYVVSGPHKNYQMCSVLTRMV